MAQPLLGPSPDKCRMPDGRPLGRGLAVSSPDVLAQLRDAGGRIDLADGENACLPFIGSNPAMRFDSRNDHVAGGACPRWRGREDVEVPGPGGHSWLYMPLLHAVAGQLDATAAADWRAHPHVGPQWHALVCALGEAPPAAPAALIRQIEARARRWPHARGLGDSTARLQHPRLHRGQFEHLECYALVHGWYGLHPSYGAKCTARALWRGLGSLRCT